MASPGLVGTGQRARRRSGRSDEGEDEAAAVRRRWAKTQWMGVGVEARWGGAGSSPSSIQSSGGRLGGGRGRRSTGWRSGEAGVVRGAGWFDPDPIWIGRGERWHRGREVGR